MLSLKRILLTVEVLLNLVFLKGNEAPSNENCTAHLKPPEEHEEYETTKEAAVQDYREYLKEFGKLISNETLYSWYKKEDLWKSDQRILNLIEKSLGEVRIPSAQQEIGCLPGHVMFVGLFSFYKKPPINFDEYNYPRLYDEYSFLRCGTEVDEDAITRAQTFLAQLKVFNVISKLASNRSTEIGAYLVDDCQSEIVARYQLMQLYNRTYSQPFTSDECSLNPNKRAPIIGMYPPSSGILYMSLFGEFLSLLKIPKFDKVTQSGPTDVRELLTILEHFDWRYISLVYEDGYYNEDKFLMLAAENRICIYKSWRMFETACDNLIVAKQLVLEEPANVVVIVCHNSTLLTSFMSAVETLNATSELLFVTNQNWLPDDWTFENWTAKFLTFSRHSSRTITENWEKLAEMHLSVNNDSTVNPWFKKYWTTRPICSGIATEEAFLKELLTEYTFYRGYEATCADQNCAAEFLDRNHSRRLEYFYKSKQRWHKESYTIKLTMQPGDIYLGYYVNDNSEISQFTLEDNSSLLPFQSRCSEVCGPKEIKVMSMAINSCCWTCTLCALSQPNEDQTACVPLPVIPFRWNDVEIVISVLYSICVIFAIAATFFIFIKYRNTPAVKSTTRELSFMMLTAMLATESIVFIFMLNQQSMTITCHAIRAIVFVSFTTMYGALLMRTIRIARLLSLSKNEFPPLKLRFMSGLSQVVITLTLMAVELVLVLAVYPDPNYDYAYNDNLDFPTRKPYCILDTSSVIINFSFVFILVIACTGCAVWVRNVPENFNEAKHIGFCMYTTCLTWLASGFMFLDKSYQVFTLCICVTTNTLVVLIFLFLPKLYIIIKKPESNDKRYFHAIKGIRCRMFTSSGPSISSVIPT